jgi:hypothetical protein
MADTEMVKARALSAETV